MNFNRKETISFNGEEEDTISDMITLLDNISGNCEDDDLRYSVVKLKYSIEEFLQNYREVEE